MSQSYDKTINDANRVVKSSGPGSLADLAQLRGAGQPGTLIRAERTGEVLVVSGYTGGGQGELKNFPWHPETNLKASVMSGGYPFGGPAPPEGSRDAGGGSWSGPAGGFLGLILDSVAKRSEGEEPGLKKVCPAGIITGSCANGHRFAKEVYCGREWCQVCNGKWEKGQAMKPSHARRFARWYPKAQQFEGVGYWTFTIPQGLRSRYRTKEALGELGHKVQQLLKSYGYSRGLRRWHFFGDRSQEWHPHLNCLVDGGRISRHKLHKLRREYSRLLGVKLAIAEYHYFDSPGEKVHALTYVTRATFLDWTWNPDMARELRGFRNQLWWGSKLWNRQPVWSLDDLPGEPAAGSSDEDTRALASLECGECPRCGLPITWERFLPASVLPELGGCELVSGYWELPCVRPPPYHLELSGLEMVRYWRKVIRQAKAAELCGSCVADGKINRLITRHRSFVQQRSYGLENRKADRALLSEVDNLVSCRGFPPVEGANVGSQLV